jgi:transcriptional regulator with XRE-family HTH domain
MSNIFGKTLREVRIQARIGLRELSRLIDKSAGYLSDVENGRVPPPSQAVIMDIATALQLDKNALLMAAKKVDPELSDYVIEQPQAADFLRLAKEQEFDDKDWESLNQLAKIARLGKGEKNKK